MHFLWIGRLGWKETRGKNNHLKEDLEHWKFRDVSSDEQRGKEWENQVSVIFATLQRGRVKSLVPCMWLSYRIFIYILLNFYVIDESLSRKVLTNLMPYFYEIPNFLWKTDAFSYTVKDLLDKIISS